MPRLPALALALLLASGEALADCPTDGVAAFPAPESVVPTNSRFILEGLGSEQARVAALVGREVVLKGGDDYLTAKVQKGWTGARSRTAVVLRPVRSFKPNRIYQLELESLLPGATVVGIDGSSTLRWQVGESADLRPPSFRLKPSIAEGLYRAEGQAVTEFVKVHTTLVEQSPAYLIVTLRRARGATATQTYFVPLNGGEGRLGRDACGGGFAFEPGRAYKAQIDVFDSSGNKAPALPTVEFQAPKPVGP